MQLNTFFSRLIGDISTKPFYGPAYASIRSLLALATLSFLVFNSSEIIFYYGLNNEMTVICTGKNPLSLFCVFGVENLLWARIFSIAVLLAVISGYFPRFTGVLHWWVAFSISSSLYNVDGGDMINAIFTFFLIPFTLFDKRINHWHKAGFSLNIYQQITLFLFALVVKMQVAVIYLHAGVAKMGVQEWTNGTAVYYWFNDLNFGSSGLVHVITAWLTSMPFTVSLITWGTMLLEVLLFSALFSSNRNFKNILFFTAVFFHLGIWAVHGLFSFALIMIACLVMYLKFYEWNALDFQTIKEKILSPRRDKKLVLDN